MPKVCTCCGIEKSMTDFCKDKHRKDGRYPRCKVCTKVYYTENKDKILAYYKGYRVENIETIKVDEKLRYEKNKDSRSVKAKIYRQENKEKISEQKKERYQSNPQCRLAITLRNRVWWSINGNYKSGSAVRDLGMPVAAFLVYLNLDCLDKYGELYTGNESKYHVDHIRPLASFDLTDRTQFLQAANWSNMQILLAFDNISKSDKLDWKPNERA